MNTQKLSTYARLIHFMESEGQIDELFMTSRDYDKLRHDALQAALQGDRLPSDRRMSYRDFEVTHYHLEGRHPADDCMAYNLVEAMEHIDHAYRILTDDTYRRYQSGFTARQAPEKALWLCSKALGYRYDRGLLAIICRLTGRDLEQFRLKRNLFRDIYDATSDTAHRKARAGAKDARERALSVVRLCMDEMESLIVPLSTTGNGIEAERLAKMLKDIGHTE